MIEIMLSFSTTFLIIYLLCKESHACAKHEAHKTYCDVHSYYHGNCTYDRFGIREQLRLPEGIHFSMCI